MRLAGIDDHVAGPKEWMDRRGRDNVNHSAHLWGAGYGVVFMLVMEPRVLGLFLERLMNPGWGG